MSRKPYFLMQVEGRKMFRGGRRNGPHQQGETDV
jgi:hypothetical protein